MKRSPGRPHETTIPSKRSSPGTGAEPAAFEQQSLIFKSKLRSRAEGRGKHLPSSTTPDPGRGLCSLCLLSLLNEAPQKNVILCLVSVLMSDFSWLVEDDDEHDCVSVLILLCVCWLGYLCSRTNAFCLSQPARLFLDGCLAFSVHPHSPSPSLPNNVTSDIPSLGFQCVSMCQSGQKLQRFTPMHISFHPFNWL